MSIEYQMQVQGDLLLVETSGADDNLDEVKNYGMAVIRAALEGKCRRILCDELNLEYRLGTVDTFESAQFIASQAPHVAKIAIVCSLQSSADAAFWETVAVNRGLSVCMFHDRAEAAKWLEE